jgi:hypothetical protein
MVAISALPTTSNYMTWVLGELRNSVISYGPYLILRRYVRTTWRVAHVRIFYFWLPFQRQRPPNSDATKTPASRVPFPSITIDNFVVKNRMVDRFEKHTLESKE